MSERQTAVAVLMARELERLRSRRKEIEETARVAHEKLAADVEELRRLVRYGKATSGDRITDFFFGGYGFIDDSEVSKLLRDIEAQLAGKKEQLFLVVRRERERDVFRLIGGRADFHIKVRYYLGILSDDKLILDLEGGRDGLPAARYAALSGDQSPAIIPGPFYFICAESLRLPPKPSDFFQENPLGRYSVGRALEVYIGCTAVLGYMPSEMRSEPWIINRNRAIRLLGGHIVEAPEERTAKEQEKKQFLATLDSKRDLLKTMKKDSHASSGEVKKCEEALRALLAQAQQRGYSEETLVRLIAEELGTPIQ